MTNKKGKCKARKASATVAVESGDKLRDERGEEVGEAGGGVPAYFHDLFVVDGFAGDAGGHVGDE